MNKSFMLVFAMLVVSAFAIASVSVAATSGTTLIVGTIYDDANHDIVYPGSNVTINCNGNIQNAVASDLKATYQVAYSEAVCGVGDTVYINASYDTGSQILTGNANTTVFDLVAPVDLGLNLADGDVFLVPEFGFLLAGLTIFASIGAFFLIRRN